MNLSTVTEQQCLGAPPSAPHKLQKLSPKHKEVLSLVAQGVRHAEIASLLDFAEDYIPYLLRQEVCKQYLQDMMAVVDHRLTAMTAESVDVIQDVLKCGSHDNQLKAAKLQLEAVGRIGTGKLPQGAGTTAPDYLQVLAGRLIGMLNNARQTTGAVIYENETETVEPLLCTEHSDTNEVQGAQA